MTKIPIDEETLEQLLDLGWAAVYRMDGHPPSPRYSREEAVDLLLEVADIISEASRQKMGEGER